jgi:hypothetical protein
MFVSINKPRLIAQAGLVGCIDKATLQTEQVRCRFGEIMPCENALLLLFWLVGVSSGSPTMVSPTSRKKFCVVVQNHARLTLLVTYPAQVSRISAIIAFWFCGVQAFSTEV